MQPLTAEQYRTLRDLVEAQGRVIIIRDKQIRTCQQLTQLGYVDHWKEPISICESWDCWEINAAGRRAMRVHVAWVAHQIRGVLRA